ncbi:hypothetical protein RF11_10873 [Thelohanellus kitauei]|uniref:Uncharacterized protein n=1 Tax=Thelohanellus kitauei TaxID=669202 RepID=A0A0C2M176_THEKT|nr:hypothetical protein RF11_10873 [Thelohanellus kitauei]
MGNDTIVYFNRQSNCQLMRERIYPSINSALIINIGKSLDEIIDIIQLRNRILKNIQGNETKRNMTRDRNYVYTLHDKVFLKEVVKTKFDYRFESQYEVLGLMHDPLYFQITIIKNG